MRGPWEVVVCLRPTLFVAIFAYLVLALPSQMHELYLIDIENVLLRQRLADGPNSIISFILAVRPILVSMAFGLLSMIMLWLASVHLLALQDQAAKPVRWERACGHVLVALIALAPIIGMLVGLTGAWRIIGREQNASELTSAMLNYVALTVALLVAGWALLTVETLRWRDRATRIAAVVFAPIGFAIGAAVIILFSLAVVRWPTTLPWALGTQAIVFLFLASLAFVLTGFSRAYRRTGIPVTVIVLAAGLVFSLNGWNDNHRVKYSLGERPLDMESGFLAWLKNRGDLDYYKERNKPYPVYVVAAEGGGMYAGYHVASFLSDMQRDCPNFSQHVFAISSVSGGSLGAGAFAAVVNRNEAGVANGKHKPCTPMLSPTDAAERPVGFVGTAMHTFFSNDFLAPLVAATLFPDFLQRIIPYPIPQFSRAHALEQAFTLADGSSSMWTGLGKNSFADSMNNLWSPTGAAPALFLNTTSVEMGARITLGPLTMGSTPTGLHITGVMCDGSRAVDIPLATAISLSARFPWLTPAGWLQKDTTLDTECGETPTVKRGDPKSGLRDRLYLVDGGYFENSGLETAVQIARRLKALARVCTPVRGGGVIVRTSLCSALPENGFEVRLIMAFTMDEFAEQFWSPFADLSAGTPGEIFAPLKTMLNTRVSRTRAVHIRESLFDDDYRMVEGESRPLGRYKLPGVQFLGVDDLHQVMLDRTKTFLPLGWRLSAQSLFNASAKPSAPTMMTYRLIAAELMGEDTETIKRPPSPPTR